MLLGHSHPAVVAAVEDQLSRESTFFAMNEQAILLAEEIVGAVSSVEQVRFTSSGTEATWYALRIARAATGREKILKFEGGYHGMHDYALMSLRPSRTADYPVPGLQADRTCYSRSAWPNSRAMPETNIN